MLVVPSYKTPRRNAEVVPFEKVTQEWILDQVNQGKELCECYDYDSKGPLMIGGKAYTHTIGLKLFIDVDLTYNVYEPESKKYKLAVDIMTVINGLRSDPENWAIVNGSRYIDEPTVHKASFHVHHIKKGFRRLELMKTYMENGTFYEDFPIFTKIKEVIDMAVYNKNRVFRLPYNKFKAGVLCEQSQCIDIDKHKMTDFLITSGVQEYIKITNEDIIQTSNIVLSEHKDFKDISAVVGYEAKLKGIDISSREYNILQANINYYFELGNIIMQDKTMSKFNGSSSYDKWINFSFAFKRIPDMSDDTKFHLWDRICKFLDGYDKRKNMFQWETLKDKVSSDGTVDIIGSIDYTYIYNTAMCIDPSKTLKISCRKTQDVFSNESNDFSNINSEFDYDDFCMKWQDQYVDDDSKQELFTDLSRCFAYIRCDEKPVLLKRRGRKPIRKTEAAFIRSYGDNISLIVGNSKKNKKGTVKLMEYILENHMFNKFTYRNEEFQPNPKEMAKRYLNSFQGFPCKMLTRFTDDDMTEVHKIMKVIESKNSNYLVTEDKQFTNRNHVLLAAILNNIKEVFAEGNDAYFEYIVNWLAVLLQRPFDKGDSCLVFVSPEGYGKSMFFHFMQKLISRDYCQFTSKIDQVVGKFDSIRLQKFMIVLEEMIDVYDNNQKQKIWNDMKQRISEKMTSIEAKYQSVSEQHTDYCRYVILSNNYNCIPYEIAGFRRFKVFHCGSKYEMNHKYYKNMNDVVFTEGVDIFYTYLMGLDVSGVSHYDNFTTSHMLTARLDSISAINKFMINMFKRKYNRIDNYMKIELEGKQDDFINDRDHNIKRIVNHVMTTSKHYTEWDDKIRYEVNLIKNDYATDELICKLSADIRASIGLIYTENYKEYTLDDLDMMWKSYMEDNKIRYSKVNTGTFNRIMSSSLKLANEGRRKKYKYILDDDCMRAYCKKTIKVDFDELINYNF